MATASPVVVSALYSQGGRTYARMYEPRGHESRVSIKYSMEQARLTEVDLAGEEGGLLSGPLDFRPWQTRTIRIEPLK